MGWITESKVRRAGKRDGRDWKWKLWPVLKIPKEPMPSKGQKTPAEEELKLKELADKHIQELSIAWSALDTKLKPEYCRIVQKEKELEERLKKETLESEVAKGKYETALDSFHELEAPAMGHFWMLFWLIVIGAAEFPLNGLIFSIFGEGQIMTYIMAGVMCFGIPLMAHWLGHKLRQERKNQTDLMLMLASIALFLILLFAIGFLRSKYLAALLGEYDIGVSISPAMATLIFLILNIAAFFIALIVSYAGTHPQHITYITRKHYLEETLEKWKKEAGEAGGVASELASTKEERVEKKHYREKKWRWFREGAVDYQQLTEYLMSIYRQANCNARPASDKPVCFEQPYPAITIPANLSSIDWQCE